MNKDIIIIIIGRVLQTILMVVSMRTMTSILSSAEIGIYSLLSAIIYFFTLTLIGPVGLYINRALHRWQDEGEVRNNFVIFYFYTLVVALLSSILILVFQRYLSSISNISTWGIVSLVYLGIVLGAFSGTLTSTINFFEFKIAFVIISTLGFFLALLFSVVATKVNGQAGYWLFGQICAQIIVVFISDNYLNKKTQNLINFKKIILSCNKHNLKAIAKFSMPLLFTAFFIWTMTDSFRFFVEKSAGISYLGRLTLGLGIAIGITSVMDTLVVRIHYPIFYKNINTSDSNTRALAWEKIFRVALPVYLVTTFFLSFLARQLIIILADYEYHEYYIFIVYGAWINFLNTMTNLVSYIGHSEMNTRVLILPYFSGTAVTILGISKLPVAYIPLSLVLGAATGLVIMIIQMRKIQRIPLNLKLITLSVFFSTPFSIALFISTGSLYNVLAVTGVAGVYYLIIQYYFYKKEGYKDLVSQFIIE